jgi:hypothetical protein
MLKRRKEIKQFRRGGGGEEKEVNEINFPAPAA